RGNEDDSKGQRSQQTGYLSAAASAKIKNGKFEHRISRFFYSEILNPAIRASSLIEFLDTFFPLYSIRSSISPVKISVGLYFFKIILSSSTNISRGSLSFT